MIGVDKGICPHDHRCPLIAICPVGAISQGADGYPIINHDLCIECGKCVRSCPMKAVKQMDSPKEAKPAEDKAANDTTPSDEDSADENNCSCSGQGECGEKGCEQEQGLGAGQGKGSGRGLGAGQGKGLGKGLGHGRRHQHRHNCLHSHNNSTD